MRRSYYIVLLAGLCILNNGCGDKKDTAPPADTAAVIQYTTPSAGATFLNGTTMQVKGNIIDNDGISAVKLEVRNTASNTVMYQQNISTSSVTYFDFNFNWTVAGISSATNATVRVICTDRYSYQVSKDVSVVLTD